MPTFTPPVADGRRIGDPDDPSWAYFKFMGSWATGKTVWKDSQGVWHESIEPYAGGATATVHDGPVTTTTAPDEGLATAQKVYLGGHEHPVTVAEANELVAAGYTFDWWQLTDWTHSWDVADSEVVGGRIARIRDRAGDRPMRRWPRNSIALFGGDETIIGLLPGPLYLASSPRFGGRPGLQCDLFARKDDPPGSHPGGSPIFNLYGGLTPNVSPDGLTGPSTDGSDQDNSVAFDPPDGYDQPYWVAVLGRVGSADNPDDDPDVVGGGVLDSIHGTTGTGPSIGGLLFGIGTNYWSMSNFGPAPVQIQTSHLVTKNETVLILAHVNGASSFLEVTWRTAGGDLTTQRVTGTLPAHRYRELFLGWIHGQYISTLGIKLGIPAESELDFIRTWAAAFIPAAAVLPPGV